MAKFEVKGHFSGPEYFDLVCNCGLDDIKINGDEGDMIHVLAASMSY